MPIIIQEFHFLLLNLLIDLEEKRGARGNPISHYFSSPGVGQTNPLLSTKCLISLPYSSLMATILISHGMNFRLNGFGGWFLPKAKKLLSMLTYKSHLSLSSPFSFYFQHFPRKSIMGGFDFKSSQFDLHLRTFGLFHRALLHSFHVLDSR